MSSMNRARKLVEELGKQASYAVGNSTQKVLDYENLFKDAGRTALSLQTGKRMGRTAFGILEDSARGDKVCTAPFLPLRANAKIYALSKAASIASIGLMEFRNQCKASSGKFCD